MCCFKPLLILRYNLLTARFHLAHIFMISAKLKGDGTAGREDEELSGIFVIYSTFNFSPFNTSNLSEKWKISWCVSSTLWQLSSTYDTTEKLYTNQRLYLLKAYLNLVYILWGKGAKVEVKYKFNSSFPRTYVGDVTNVFILDSNDTSIPRVPARILQFSDGCVWCFSR